MQEVFGCWSTPGPNLQIVSRWLKSIPSEHSDCKYLKNKTNWRIYKMNNNNTQLVKASIVVSARTSSDVCRVYRMWRQRFITGARKYDHISPVLRDLHWLPLRQRIIFKIATLMHQCLNGLAPSYLATDCIAISSMPGRRQLRSAASGQLYISRTKTMTFRPRSFKVSGPTIWNDLPARLKDSSLSKNSFRKLLKTFLFDRWPLHMRICGVY